MNTYMASLIFSALVLISSGAKAQGTFQNLDFELANVPNGTSVGSFIPVSEAIPGWTPYFIDNGTIMPQTQVGYDLISLGGYAISLEDAQAVAPIQGSYSVYLFGGGAPSVVSASISQTGQIPSGTETLLMDARIFNASPVVAINGQVIIMAPLQTFANYTLYGGNISAFAGETATLSFTDPAPANGPPSQFLLDNIQFSTQSVPETDPFILTGLGGSLFALYRRFAPKRK